MSKREPLLYLQDILTSLSRIEDYTKSLSFEGLKDDWKTIDAVVRNLEILGEAARNIPEEIIDKYPDVPWGYMVSMRNKVLHEYFGVDLDILWKTVKEDLPLLKQQVEEIVESLTKSYEQFPTYEQVMEDKRGTEKLWQAVMNPESSRRKP